MMCNDVICIFHSSLLNTVYVTPLVVIRKGGIFLIYIYMYIIVDSTDSNMTRSLQLLTNYLKATHSNYSEAVATLTMLSTK